MKKKGGFTLIELLVVILILAILMAIALPLYLRAVRDSQRQTCRSNMQTIANACQAHKVRSTGHVYPGYDPATGGLQNLDLTAAGPLMAADANGNQDLVALPRCPSDTGAAIDDDYTATFDDGTNELIIFCNSDNANELTYHNTVGADTAHGFIVGVDSE